MSKYAWKFIHLDMQRKALKEFKTHFHIIQFFFMLSGLNIFLTDVRQKANLANLRQNPINCFEFCLHKRATQTTFFFNTIHNFPFLACSE